MQHMQSSYSRHPLPPTAATLARRKDPEQAEREAREACCDQHLAEQLAGFARYPMGEHREDGFSLWHLFAERQFERGEPMEQPLARLLAVFTTMSSAAIDGLRDIDSNLADVALLLRDDVRDLLLEEAAGEFDSRKPQEPDYD
ncbi:hypothetical protein [Oceanisphaera sp. KMM 10153]|uniref:hypothetical protein n=1 Tax=Oceanisphaera submarina TaxID=3390193 RepID=UPI003976209B